MNNMDINSLLNMISKMDKEELWNNFETSGKIEDYLRYKMESNISSGVENEIIQSEGNSNKGDTI